MKWLLFLSAGLVSLGSQAQVDSSTLVRSTRLQQSGYQQLQWLRDDPTGTAAVALAERDIQAKTPFLLLGSGGAPVVITTDAAFERQFQVNYVEMGCTSPPPASVRAYNERTFAYLQATYGKTWRRHVRPDVVGLRRWKPRQ
jgi:hypothetical protein